MTTQQDKPTHTVLVVEDEQPIRKLVATTLRKDGYNVLEASSPTEAAEALGSGLFSVDLLFADIVMPGMTGTEFAKEMISMLPGLKIVFATGLSTEELKESPGAGKYNFYLQKPYTADQLREAVRVTLNS